MQERGQPGRCGAWRSDFSDGRQLRWSCPGTT